MFKDFGGRELECAELVLVSGGEESAPSDGDLQGTEGHNPENFNQATWGEVFCYTSYQIAYETADAGYGPTSAELADEACDTNFTGTNPGPNQGG